MSGKEQLSRSEIVRQRRSQQKNRRIVQAGQQAYQPLPPVTARAPVYVVPKKKGRPARRFNLSLVLPNLLPYGHVQPRSRVDITGRTYAGPSLAPRDLGWRILSLVILLGMIASIYFSWSTPFFRAEQALVTGNLRMTTEEINSVLGIAGQPVFLLKPQDITSRLRQNYHEVASARARVYFPNKVWVGMVERMPIIQWQQDGQYTWIDASGVAFKPRGQETALIPIAATGLPPAGVSLSADPLDPVPFLSHELLDAIQILAPHIPAGTSMLFNPEDGLGWKDSRGWLVFFGDSSRNINLKLHIYYSLVDDLIGRGIYPEYISMRYPDAPYYRLSNSEEVEPTTVEPE